MAFSDRLRGLFERQPLYDEGTFSIYQFRQTLQQSSQGYDCESIVEAEPAIRQLLKLDFEPKVSATIRRNFRQIINQVIKTQMLPSAEKQVNEILQQYNHARTYLEQTLEKEAESKIASNRYLRTAVEQKIEFYNQAVSGINMCLQAMQLYEHFLPKIGDSDLLPVSTESEAFNSSPVDVLNLNEMPDTVEVKV